MTRPLAILLAAGLLAGGCHKAPAVRWYGCAPAAAARVLAYWGANTTAQRLAVAMSTDTMTGSTESDHIAVGIEAVAPDLCAALTWNDSTALEGTGLLCMVGRDHVVTFGLPGDSLPCLDSLRAFAVVGVRPDVRRRKQ